MKKMLSIFSFGMFMLLSQQFCHAYDYNGLNINGFISQGYLRTNHNDYLADTKGGTFDFNELGLNFGYQATDSIHFSAQILSRNLGVDGDNKFTFGYASGDYRYNSYLGLRGGKNRIPMGLYNQSRDIDMLRPGVFLPNAIYDDADYTFYSAFYGLLFYGQLPLSFAGDLEYQFFGGKPDTDADSYYARNQANDLGSSSRLGAFYNIPGYGDPYGRDINIDSDGVSTYGGALLWNTPLDGFRMGYSWLYNYTEFTYTNVPYYTKVQFKNKVSPRQVLSFEYTWDDLVVSAEYMKFDFDFDVRMGLPGNYADLQFNLDICSFYLGASYRFTDWMQLGLTYSEFYVDKDDKKGEAFVVSGRPDFMGWIKDITLSARFDITDNWIVKAEYHIMDGAAGLPRNELYSDANSTPNTTPGHFDGGLDDNLKQKWNMVALKTTFSF